MRQGYTNTTRLRDAEVCKVFEGPDAAQRQTVEQRALAALQGRFPVPALVGAGEGWISTAYVEGSHGQDLIEAGQGRAVLGECGRLLARLQAVDPRVLTGEEATSAVIQHGDFGPNNILFARDVTAAAVVDWEFCAVGPAITDIAWCEWIVRMHHPAAVDELDALFEAYGHTPAWPERHAAMMLRCAWLGNFADRWHPGGPAVQEWRRRLRVVEKWRE